jgi:hypothetical protein
VIAICCKNRIGNNSILGLGVDTEPKSRFITNKLIQRITHKKQKFKFKSHIKAWCAAEAAFKADPNNQNSVISETLFLNSQTAKRPTCKIVLKHKTLNNSLISIAVSTT